MPQDFGLPLTIITIAWVLKQITTNNPLLVGSWFNSALDQVRALTFFGLVRKAFANLNPSSISGSFSRAASGSITSSNTGRKVGAFGKLRNVMSGSLTGGTVHNIIARSAGGRLGNPDGTSTNLSNISSKLARLFGTDDVNVRVKFRDPKTGILEYRNFTFDRNSYNRYKRGNLLDAILAKLREYGGGLEDYDAEDYEVL